MSSRCQCGAPATDGSLCTEHAKALDHTIAKTPGLLDELDVTITKTDAQGLQGAGNNTNPLPYNARASNARQRLTRALQETAYVALGRTLKGATRATPKAIAQLALINKKRLHASPLVHELADRLNKATIEATAAIDRAEEWITYGQCSCNNELGAPRSRDVAICTQCGARWNVAQLKAWRHVQAADAAHGYIGTIGKLVEISVGLGQPVTRRQIVHLTERKNDPLPSVGLHKGHNVYRWADVLDRLQAK